MGRTHSNIPTVDPPKVHLGGAELVRLMSDLMSLRAEVIQAELSAALSLEISKLAHAGSLQRLRSEIALLRREVEQAEHDQTTPIEIGTYAGQLRI